MDTGVATTQVFAERQDAADQLASWRAQFHFPKGSPLYFCGNSLGLQPKTTRKYVEEELEAWRTMGVEAHFDAATPWFSYHESVRDQLAALVGATPAEVVAMNSLTVNLHLLMVSFYRPTKERYKILIEGSAFPSDQYAVASQVSFHGFVPEDAIVEVKPRAGENTLRTSDICATIEEHSSSLALVLLGGVNYLTGQAFDMATIAAATHKVGAVCGIDLAHAAGNIPLQLHDWNIDFAAWCSYKYLNSGPGGIAGAFVHDRHAARQDLPRFAGWWGHDKERRFLMEPTFSPIKGAEGWQLSNPPILPLASLRASLDIFSAASMSALRDKSVRLTSYLETLLREKCGSLIAILTPADADERGCQLSLRYQGRLEALKAAFHQAGVTCDFREPDVIRVAPVPLYNSFLDVYRFVDVLCSVGSD